MTYLSNIVRSDGDPKVLRSGPSSLPSSDRLGKALGWFSLGLGLVELIAPRRITRVLGMEGKEALLRAYGAREVGSGILSLSIEKQLGLWSRVAGDGIDIATLLAAHNDDNPNRENVTFALALIAGITLLDIIALHGTTSARSRTPSDRDIYQGRSGFFPAQWDPKLGIHVT